MQVSGTYTTEEKKMNYMQTVEQVGFIVYGN